AGSRFIAGILVADCGRKKGFVAIPDDRHDQHSAPRALEYDPATFGDRSSEAGLARDREVEQLTQPDRPFVTQYQVHFVFQRQTGDLVIHADSFPIMTDMSSFLLANSL